MGISSMKLWIVLLLAFTGSVSDALAAGNTPFHPSVRNARPVAEKNVLLPYRRVPFYPGAFLAEIPYSAYPAPASGSATVVQANVQPVNVTIINQTPAAAPVYAPMSAYVPYSSTAVIMELGGHHHHGRQAHVAEHHWRVFSAGQARVIALD